jgi:hypothetical protein
MAEVLAKMAGTRKQSIARVELFTDANKNPDDWTVIFHFEDGTYDDTSGTLIQSTQFGTRRVERRFGSIKNDLAAPGVTIAQLAAMIKSVGYIYRQADIDAKAVADKAAANAAAVGQPTLKT